jgi:hypothetical protein
MQVMRKKSQITLSFVKSLEPQIDFLFPTQQQKKHNGEEDIRKEETNFLIDF